MSDSLGDRMKRQYEDRFQTYLPRRTYAILRIDGKAFHTFTKGFDKPFSDVLSYCMDKTMRRLCESIQGAQLGYTQSDEISILVTDFTTTKTDAWFDYDVQKMTSVSASMATAYFNHELKYCNFDLDRSALFDSRVFAIPDPIEVENYFVWREKDWYRNSVTMLAQSVYSHKELHGKSCDDMHEMIHQKGGNWATIDQRYRNGGWAIKDSAGVWFAEPAPIFTSQDGRASLKKHIPVHGYGVS